MNTTLNDIDRFELKWFLVAVIDLLGQKDKLRGLRLPETETDRASMTSILKGTWGLVDELRKFVFSLVNREATSSERPASVPPEHEVTWRRLRRFDIRYFAVSDAVYVWVPLDGPAQVGASYQVVYALTGTELAFLSQGHPLRGGISMGLGSDSIPPAIYGPALNEAVRLESKVARYPRVVVDRQVVQYLDSTLALAGNVIDVKVQREMARMCRSFLAQDSDGEFVLDYLGPALADELAQTEGEDTAAMGRRVHRFFSSELARWNSSGCAKLTERYREGLKYVESRLRVTQRRTSSPPQGAA